mmetsp:Transcript_86406/g.241728  ORF Transcript_86406/g.241728 Transcript_86406/m.241728 type:complete len:214 (+) Transcript_86406:1822-2463(+)
MRNFCVVWAPPWDGTTKSVAVMQPEVSVPVLSLHSTLMHPRVSMESILRTSTCWFDMFEAEIIRLIVTVANNPSGTCAKIASAVFLKLVAAFALGWIEFAAKFKIPTTRATIAITCTKCSIWISSEDFGLAAEMFTAICPRTVLLPVLKTTHSIRPWTTDVPMKRRFFASLNGRPGGTAAEERGSTSDSPVSAEFSTRAPSVQSRTRMSAGTF